MPRKVKHEGGSSESDSKRQKQKEDKPEFDDWRAPLYFWHGSVRTDDYGDTTWEGTWIASETGLPSPSEFEACKNTFKFVCTDFLERDGVGLEDACPYGRSGNFHGSFKLNNDGTGLRDYADLEHRIVFKNHSAGWSLAGARGTAEFGEFISAGRLTFPQGETPAYLTLARRYLKDDDPRTQLSAWGTVLQIESNMEGREAPWKQLGGG
jgi:hypothetical protein